MGFFVWNDQLRTFICRHYLAIIKKMCLLLLFWNGMVITYSIQTSDNIFEGLRKSFVIWRLGVLCISNRINSWYKDRKSCNFRVHEVILDIGHVSIKTNSSTVTEVLPPNHHEFKVWFQRQNYYHLLIPATCWRERIHPSAFCDSKTIRLMIGQKWMLMLSLIVPSRA